MLPDVGYRVVRDRYLALARLRSRNGGAAWFHARMLGRRALVVAGENGARLFYDATLVTRAGAVPAPVRLMLFGPGAVHGLSGDEHADRKQLFLQIVDRQAADDLSRRVRSGLDEAAVEWVSRGTVRLFGELTGIYGRAVIEWAGIELEPSKAAAVTVDLAAMVDAFGLGGTSYARGLLARVRTTAWARSVIREVREGRRSAPADSALARVAARVELNHTVAGVELLNVLRPTVAVAYFGAYAAHALSNNPQWKAGLASGSSAELRAFDHELRRCYPFVPLLTGRLVRDYTWQGRRYPRGSWMVLDVLGTNLDPRHWRGADTFDPGRFLEWEPGAFDFVPQGGGDPAHGHRCPGEPLAIGILEATVQVLAGLDFQIATPDDSVPLDRIPSLPPHGMELHNLRPADVIAPGR